MTNRQSARQSEDQTGANMGEHSTQSRPDYLMRPRAERRTPPAPGRLTHDPTINTIVP